MPPALDLCHEYDSDRTGVPSFLNENFRAVIFQPFVAYYGSARRLLVNQCNPLIELPINGQLNSFFVQVYTSKCTSYLTLCLRMAFVLSSVTSLTSFLDEIHGNYLSHLYQIFVSHGKSLQSIVSHVPFRALFIRALGTPRINSCYHQHFACLSVEAVELR